MQAKLTVFPNLQKKERAEEDKVVLIKTDTVICYNFGEREREVTQLKSVMCTAWPVDNSFSKQTSDCPFCTLPSPSFAF